MATVTASRLTKAIGARTLFSGVSFKLERGERMTLSGRNGSGKTTLLRMLAGEIGADEGTISMPGGSRVSLHDQRPPRSDASLQRLRPLRPRLDHRDRGRADRARDADGRGRRQRGHARRPTPTPRPATSTPAATAGVSAPSRPPRGLGISTAELDRPLASFSGGELTRASLARALATRPDLLLLDEPTNHLDIESLEWLENYLDRPRRRGRARRPRPLVPGVGGHLGARARGAARPATSRARGTRGARSGRPASSRPGATSSSARPRSPGWSASSSASATRRRRPARRSRG